MGSLVQTPLSEVMATLESLAQFGVGGEHLSHVRKDERHASRVASAFRDASASERVARALLGRDRFFGAEEWVARYHVPSHALKEGIPEFPWAEDVLRGPCPFVKGECVMDTHFAFLSGFPFTSGAPVSLWYWSLQHVLLMAKNRYGERAGTCGDKWDIWRWYLADEQRAQETIGFEPAWHLMLLEAAPDSVGDALSRNKDALPKNYTRPRAVEEMTKDVLYHTLSGRYPNPNVWARCCDMVEDFLCVAVGGWEDRDVHASCERGVVIRSREYVPEPKVGLAASRKPSA